MATVTLIDTHCHYYPRSTDEIFFTALVRNLHRQSLQYQQASLGICLLDFADTQYFQRLADPAGGFPFSITRLDDQSLGLAIEGHHLSVFCGRQLVSAEGLEVILYGCREEVCSGRPILDYIEEYQQQYLVALPWGVGKWFGRRGKIMSQLLSEEHGFVLGDIASRPAWWSAVPQFSQASRQSVPILAGSDALPVPAFLQRLGSYGSLFPGELKQCQQWIDLVKQKRESFRPFGRQVSTAGFLSDQLLLRLARHG
jgi:hypothetical protein